MQRPLAGLLVVLILLPGSALAELAEEGKPPPLFALADDEGTIHRLEDYFGTPTVLYFTHNLCHYCTQIIAFLKRARSSYSEEELAILTLNVWADGPRLIRRYKEQFGLPFPMLAGKDPQLLRDYEVNYVPIVIFIDADGQTHRIYHHYILQADFLATVAEIAGPSDGASAGD